MQKAEEPYRGDRPGQGETGCCEERALMPSAAGGQGWDGGQWGARQVLSAQLAGDLGASACVSPKHETRHKDVSHPRRRPSSLEASVAPPPPMR